MSSRSIRFGVGDGRACRGATWKCCTTRAAGKSDVYLACRELGGALKASFHESGNWQIAFDDRFLRTHTDYPSTRWNTRFVSKWPRPRSIAPGTTLAFRILTPRAAVCPKPSAREGSGIVWIAPPPNGKAVEVDVIITSPSTRSSSWPGKRAMGTQLVGRLETASGETVWVVHRLTEMPALPTLRGQPRYFSGATAADLKAPGLRAILIGTEPDGSRVMYDCVFGPPELDRTRKE